MNITLKKIYKRIGRDSVLRFRKNCSIKNYCRTWKARLCKYLFQL